MGDTPYFDTWTEPVPTAEIVYKTDPIELSIDVYSPDSDAYSAQPGPAILWFHVGAAFYGDRKTMLPRWLFKRAKELGYTMISVDYRLAPESDAHDIASDLKDSWAFVRSKLNDRLSELRLPTIDTEKLAVAGSSAGGYMSLQGGHLFDPLPKAVVTISAQCDTDPQWWATPHPASLEIAGVPIQTAFDMEDQISKFFEKGKKPVSGVPYVGDGRAREMLYHYVIGKGIHFRTLFGVDEISSDPALAYLWPQKSITSNFPPTYMLAGTGDQSVPHTESINIGKILEEKGVTHKMRLLEGKDHFLDQEEDVGQVKEARDEIVNFLRKYLE